MPKKTDTTTCATCKHIVSKEHAQEVGRKDGGDKTDSLWYCPEHRKPYDRIEKQGVVGYCGTVKEVRHYYKEVGVDREGTTCGERTSRAAYLALRDRYDELKSREILYWILLGVSWVVIASLAHVIVF